MRSQSAETYYYLGLIDFQKRKNLDAVQKLVQALRIEPSNVKALSLLGSICLLEKATYDAIQALEKCIVLSPSTCEYYLLLGSAYLQDERERRSFGTVSKRPKDRP